MYAILKTRILIKKDSIPYGLTLVALIIIVYLQWKDTARTIPDAELEELACHYSRSEDALPSLTNVTFLPPSKSIFFIETSCLGTLSSRQACVVESASRAHPNWQIYVLFSSPVKQEHLKSGTLARLKKFRNVKVLRVHVDEFIQGTPLFDILGKVNAPIPFDVAEVLKYMTMYKYSGIYLGLDVIVARSFEDLTKNWVVKENSVTVSTAMFSFSDDVLGRQLSQVTVGELLSGTRENLWSSTGIGVLKNLLTFWCATNHFELISANTICNDLAVYDTPLFYPIPFYERYAYFESFGGGNLDPDVFTYPTWESSTNYPARNNTYYAKLARCYCPKIYEVYGKRMMLD